jgi:translocation and assembly module TamA
MRRLAPLLLAACGVLGGCAALRPAADAKDGAPPAPPPVEVVVDAPGPLAALLSTHLDLARLSRDAAGETIEELELRRLQNATPAQARELLATEGYMSPEVRVTRESDAQDGSARPRVRVAVTPGPRTRVETVDLQTRGPLADAAVAGDAQARATLEAWRAAWALEVGEPFTNGAWRGAKNDAIARLRSDGYAAATWGDTRADVDARRARRAGPAGRGGGAVPHRRRGATGGPPSTRGARAPRWHCRPSRGRCTAPASWWSKA